MNEIWKEIKGWEGLYEVSNFGRIKSLPKFFGGGLHKESILNPSDRRNYKRIGLCNKMKRTCFSVHRLVAQAFIPNPENKPQINHKNGVKANNFWWNLEWSTRLENMQHSWETGLHSASWRKKKIAQILNGEVVKIWGSQFEASEHFNLKGSSISACCNNRQRTAAGFQWKHI